MKNTTLENPAITVKDERIIDLDRIVGEVKQSEEWDTVKMNILEIGIEKGREEGEDRFARLTKLLLDANRSEGLNKAIADKTYRDGLYQEYNL